MLFEKSFKKKNNIEDIEETSIIQIIQIYKNNYHLKK